MGRLCFLPLLISIVTLTQLFPIAGQASETHRVLGLHLALAQSGSSSKAQLSPADEESILSELPELAPVGTPKRIQQLWERMRTLFQRRAHVSTARMATELLQLDEKELEKDPHFIAQVYLEGAKVRLTQKEIEGAERLTRKSMAIVGQTRDHARIIGSIAWYRGIDAVKEGSLSMATTLFEEAKRLHRSPLLEQRASAEVSRLARSFFEEDREKEALRAIALALDLEPRNREATLLKRDIAVYRPLMRYGIAVGILFFIFVFGLRAYRSRKMKKYAELDI